MATRAPGRLSAIHADFWVQRWKTCLPPPVDAAVRAERLGRSVARWQAIRADIAAVEIGTEALLADTAGQVLTTLPGVAVIRAAGFAAFSLPIDRFPTAEHLYSRPVWPRRVTSRRRSTAPVGSPASACPSTATRLWASPGACRPTAARSSTATGELRPRWMAPIQVQVALARQAFRLTYRMLKTQQPFDDQRYRRARHPSER